VGELDMIAEEISERLVKWSIDEVYNKWEKFALDASIYAYKVALVEARKECDLRQDLIKEFTEIFAEAQKRETEKYYEDLPIYTPIKDKNKSKSKIKDMR